MPRAKNETDLVKYDSEHAESGVNLFKAAAAFGFFMRCRRALNAAKTVDGTKEGGGQAVITRRAATTDIE